METFLDLLLGNTLTRLVFFPTLAACRCSSSARAASDRARDREGLRPGRLAGRARRSPPLYLATPPGGRTAPSPVAQRRAPALDPELRHPLRPGDGRHLDAARAAGRACCCRSSCSAPGGGSSKHWRGFSALAAAAHHRRARRPPRLRPLPVLRLLGGDADADVPADRHLGRRAADLRGGQVLPLHHGGEPADAGRHPVDGLDLPPARAAPGASPTPTCCGSTCRSASSSGCSRLRPGLRDQGADVPAPHLAARRPRRGADRRLGDPRRHPAQARHLRLPALRHAALPARQRGGAAAARRAGAHRHPLRRAGRLGAGGHEEAGRLLVDRPPRLRDARPARRRPPAPGRGRSSRWSTTASRPARSSSSSACSTTAGTPRSSPSSAASPR